MPPRWEQNPWGGPLNPLSVIEPITPAIQRTKRILFEPFQLNKWLRLGFCAFLMGLMQPGGFGVGGGQGIDSDVEDGNGQERIDAVTPWIQEHLALILVVGSLLVLLLTVLGLVFT